MRRSISVIIPAYNEEKRLPATLERIGSYLESSAWGFSEIIVVDDGSCDGTVQVARGAGARVLQNPGNCGKGYAVAHGMLAARGEWALLTDADLAAPIDELEKLWLAAERGNAQGAIGSRALDRSLIGVHQSPLREFAGRLFNVVVRLLTGLRFRDTQCGFKLFEASAAKEIFSRQRLHGFGFDVEALYLARRLGYRVVETAVRWSDVSGTTVSMWRGITAYLDPLRVSWNGWRGRYATPGPGATTHEPAAPDEPVPRLRKSA